MNLDTFFCQGRIHKDDREAFRAYVIANYGPDADMELMEWWTVFWLYMEPFPSDPLWDEREPVSQMEQDMDSAW